MYRAREEKPIDGNEAKIQIGEEHRYISGF